MQAGVEASFQERLDPRGQLVARAQAAGVLIKIAVVIARGRSVGQAGGLVDGAVGAFAEAGRELGVIP